MSHAFALLLLANPMRFASVLPAEPVRAHLDLGPVLVADGVSARSPEDVSRQLDLAAQELGADAFVYESRDLRQVYLVDTSGDGSLLALNILSVLLTGTFRSSAAPSGIRQASFYRAIRYVSDPAPELARQLTEAHGKLASGKLQVAEYVALRRRLVAHR